jgi:hypothetical protein
MPPLRRRRKSKVCAPATVCFTQARNESGQRQPCVFAQCHYAGDTVGPVWGHGERSVRRALKTLSERCQCGRRFHRKRFTEGVPAVENLR